MSMNKLSTWTIQNEKIKNLKPSRNPSHKQHTWPESDVAPSGFVTRNINSIQCARPTLNWKLNHADFVKETETLYFVGCGLTNSKWGRKTGSNLVHQHCIGIHYKYGSNLLLSKTWQMNWKTLPVYYEWSLMVCCKAILPTTYIHYLLFSCCKLGSSQCQLFIYILYYM